ncbi:MAG: hypothetical protein R2715_14160 [Ilumatobacteraceae bacterium]
MANGDGTPEDAVMTMVDSDLLDELLGTLDARARYAVEARFGLMDGERKSFREVGENPASPPRPPVDSCLVRSPGFARTPFASWRSEPRLGRTPRSLPRTSVRGIRFASASGPTL